jgi:hypothetical protein
MARRHLIFVLLVGTVAFGNSASADDAVMRRYVEVAVGEGTMLYFSSFQRIAIGDPNIADVKVLGSYNLLVVGVAEGQTSLLLSLNNGQRLTYRVDVTGRLRRVVSEKQRAAYERITSFLKTQAVHFARCGTTDASKANFNIRVELNPENGRVGRIGLQTYPGPGAKFLDCIAATLRALEFPMPVANVASRWLDLTVDVQAGGSPNTITMVPSTTP